MVSKIPPPLSTINHVEPESDDRESWMWNNEQKYTIIGYTGYRIHGSTYADQWDEDQPAATYQLLENFKNSNSHLYTN